MHWHIIRRPLLSDMSPNHTRAAVSLQLRFPCRAVHHGHGGVVRESDRLSGLSGGLTCESDPLSPG
eukprot:3862736-Prymnesium_polylepis.1